MRGRREGGKGSSSRRELDHLILEMARLRNRGRLRKKKEEEKQEFLCLKTALICGSTMRHFGPQFVHISFGYTGDTK